MTDEQTTGTDGPETPDPAPPDATKPEVLPAEKEQPAAAPSNVAPVSEIPQTEPTSKIVLLIAKMGETIRDLVARVAKLESSPAPVAAAPEPAAENQPEQEQSMQTKEEKEAPAPVDPIVAEAIEHVKSHGYSHGEAEAIVAKHGTGTILADKACGAEARPEWDE